MPSKLSIAVLPDMAPNDLEEKHASLIAYLAETLDTPCEFIIPDSYEDIVDLIAEGEADIALVGGYTYVLAKERSDIATLVSRDIDRFFTTTFIANSALEVESLEDTKSLKFAFGSELSTSGHLMPRHELLEMGIVPETYFSEVLYSDAHDKTVQWVRDGIVDVGAVNSQVIEKMHVSGDLDPAKITYLAETLPFTNYVWVVRSGISESYRKRIRSAFLSLRLSDPDHKKILNDQGAAGFLPVLDEDFGDIREAVEHNRSRSREMDAQ